MPAIAISADGQNIFIALEDGSGLPLVVKTTIDDPATFTTVYQPGTGTAANVAQSPGDSDQMIFYGNFGTGVGVIAHTVSTVTNDDISPGSLGSNVVNTLAINPDNSLEIWATVSGAQDLLKTIDGGTNWTTKNAALGINPTALAVAWPNSDKLFVAGNASGTTRLYWSSNSGTSFTNQAGAALGSTANITNVELVPLQ